VQDGPPVKHGRGSIAAGHDRQMFNRHPRQSRRFCPLGQPFPFKHLPQNYHRRPLVQRLVVVTALRALCRGTIDKRIGLCQAPSLTVDAPAILGYNGLASGGHIRAVGIDFEWDPNKAARNLRKHGVTLEEAATVFRDDLSVTAPDPDHSVEEERFITVGPSSQNRLLLVAHAERGECIRIISARELTPSERRQYEEAG
jgi:uncharacterized DUF497 family protein